MGKHYIRLDNENRIIKGFSDDFEQALETDICVNEGEGRHFELNGVINPPLTNLKGIYLYKYENDEIVQRTEEEIQRDIVTIPVEPSQTDLVMLAITELDAQREKDKADTQLAIAELANTLLGGN